MKVGLYFGTFNPIHIGHLVIANHLAEYSDLDQVWFVVHLDRALENYPKLRVSDIEFKLPQPNYTINTLTYLQEKYSEYEFSLIMGEDNLKGFHKWKNYTIILENHDIYVYPRITKGEVASEFVDHEKVHFINSPIMEISSTFIRKAIKDGKNIRPLLPEHVWQYLDEMNFYKK
ncbi:MAG: nicotinate-nucleotide adenylyltransferase [Flavobacteriaceae bacterium]